MLMIVQSDYLFGNREKTLRKGTRGITMEDQVCPRCRTTKYRNPSLKLMVNVCGHSLCESCVELLFLKGSGSCPECQVPLRRSNFRIQLFEDPVIEKEVDIRKRVLRDYNKKEEDFSTLEEYNDYLEEVEEIIYNLANNIDVTETNRRIEQYKRENKESILKNKMKIGRTELELEELLEAEKRMELSRKTEIVREEVESKRKKLKIKEALIDELMFSTSDAKDIVKIFKADLTEGLSDHENGDSDLNLDKHSQFSTGIRFSKGHDFLPVVRQEEGPPYVYTPPAFISEGPMPPEWENIHAYVQHVRVASIEEKAGGFDESIACMKALQEAVVGLYFKTT